MLQRFKNEDEGFTLIELLVVILIIGILAAIALPSFLGQQKKGQDSAAKSNARNAVTQVESCFTDKQEYGQCTSLAGSSLPTSGLDAVSVDATTPAGGYTITAKSKSTNEFLIVKDANGVTSRTCTTAGKGGCPDGGTW